MNEAVALLKERVEKAGLKVARAEKALESAKIELADFQTALRVMEGIAGLQATESSPNPSATMVSDRQALIVQMLGVGEEKGQAPADLFGIYRGQSGEEINIDTFRTTIWRMRGRIYHVQGSSFLVHGDSGHYWKERVIDLSSEAEIHEMLGDYETPKENEPTSDDAVGSVAAGWGVPPPAPAPSNPDPSWSS